MAESIVQVTEGSGKKLHTWQRTVGANNVEDEFVIPGEYPLASYIAIGSAVSCATANDDILQVMAGAALNLRIRRIRIEQEGLVTAAALALFTVLRVTTAGTLGTAITPSKMDNADVASGATAMSGVPTASKGTAGASLLVREFWPVQTAPVGGLGSTPANEWVQQPGMKPIVIPAGVTNGIVIRNGLARAGLTVHAEIEFVETSF